MKKEIQFLAKFCFSKTNVGGTGLDKSGGGEKEEGSLVEWKQNRLTMTSWSKKLTGVGKTKRVALKSKKNLGAKSRSGREPGKAKTVSSHSIKQFFNTKNIPEEVWNSLGNSLPLQIPARKT